MPDTEGAPVCDRAPMIAETHVGMVVLVGDRAYKSKKPVRTAFLDFSTPDRRAAMPCAASWSSTAGSPRTCTWASAGSPARASPTRPCS